MRSDEYEQRQSEISRLAKTFQENLRKARRVTQEKVAELAGISPRFYQIEQGRSVPTVLFAHMIAVALDVAIDELLREQYLYLQGVIPISQNKYEDLSSLFVVIVH